MYCTVYIVFFSLSGIQEVLIEMVIYIVYYYPT